MVPYSSNQDTPGPMCRSVTDAALLLTFIAGPDPRDEATLHQPGIVPDYMKALNKNALKGTRLGVPRAFIHNMNAVEETFNSSLDIFRALGAEIVDHADFPNGQELLASQAEKLVMAVDFKVGISKYISELVEVPTGVKTLADLIEFNNINPDLELPGPFYTDQSRYVSLNYIQYAFTEDMQVYVCGRYTA